MTASEPQRSADAVGWCAVLRAFDAAALRALAGDDADPLPLLERGLLAPAGGDPPRYVLVEGMRRETLAQIRATRPRDELDMHGAALRMYAARLGTVGPGAAAAADTDACLYHLGALHDLFIEYMEWDSIISYTSALHKIEPRPRRIADALEYYEAYTALRTTDPAGGARRLELLLQSPELEPATRLRALHALHIAYVYQSRYDQALRLLAEARRIARALGDQPRRSYLLLSMGQIYNDLWEFRRATALSRLSLRVAQRCGALYREMQARYEVGSNAMQAGRWDEALAELEQAEQGYRRLGMPRRIAMVLWAIGAVYQVRGEHQRCEETFHEALDLARIGDSFNILAVMDILTRLGLLEQTRGDHERALAFYQEAASVARANDLRHWLPVLSARVADILVRLGRPKEAEAHWRSAVAAIESVRADIEQDTVQITLFGATQHIYESFVLFLVEQRRYAEAFEFVERARSRAFLDLLARAAPDTEDGDGHGPGSPRADMLARPPTLAELQRHLAAGELVLEYFTTGALPAGDHWLSRIPEHNRALRQAALPAPATLAFIITRDTLDVRRLDSGPQRRAGAAQPPADLDPNRLQPSSQSEDPVLDMLRLESRIDWLSSRLLAPAEPWLQRADHLTIIPHGPLHYVPFLALRRPDGRYLLDERGPAVAFAPSAAVMLHTRAFRPSGGQGSLAIGYDGPPGNRLEHAEAEAAAIARAIGGDVWVGHSPKSRRLLAHRRLRVLHIAGHAIYDSRRAHTTALHLGDDDVLDAAAILGAAGRPCRADIVTLSSCMSGYSRVVAGDELFGLQRAFLYAVAPTIVCTLARVRDRVALIVMDQFYRRLLGPAGFAQRPAGALRDALVAVRAMSYAEANATLARYGYPGLPPGAAESTPFARPEYWAPFILVGRP